MHFGKRVQTSHSPSNGTAEKITNSNTLHSRGVNMKLILTSRLTSVNSTHVIQHIHAFIKKYMA
uniref:Uncharacterized protein n=1 Tax=Anguilla anguilla TaxID=7936 RepID=A0A0E9PF12_ANGAN